jgi:pimeloyl-ACP methyl ester carboxylesterase
MTRLIKITLIGLIGVLTIAATAGATYEALARRSARTDFPPSGKLIDIGGRRLQLDCRGSGSPTVVFESGGNTEGSLSWAGIHDQVAAKTRACAYSRAGLMWSDPDFGPRDGKAIARDLHAALNGAGEKPPFVLVGHSIAGPYVLIYTEAYGDEVAGIVFVDPTHPDQRKRQEAIVGKVPGLTFPIRAGLRVMSRLGIMRLAQPARDHSPTERAIAAYRPAATSAMLREASALTDDLAEAGAMRNLGARPIIVMTADWAYTEKQLKVTGLTADQGRAIRALWKQMHEEMAGWSTNGEHRIVPGANHDIQRSNPDQVVAAIDAVVSRVRASDAPKTE